MKKYLLVLVLALLGILAWSPWITQEYAGKKVKDNFEVANRQIIDGCGFNCTSCGLKESSKIPFGAIVTITYACGLKVHNSGPDKTSRQFVSFLGTVHSINSLQVGTSP